MLRTRSLRTFIRLSRRVTLFLIGMVVALVGYLIPVAAQLAPSTPSQAPSAASPSLTSPNEMPTLQQCQTAKSAPTSGLTQLVSDVTQTARWMDQPGIGMSNLVSSMAPQLLAYLTPTPFPQINPRARQAKVPVMMYHDIRPDKQVFFDVTPDEFEAHLQLMQQKGVTPISMDQLVSHLRTGAPLPPKPIVLTFDDGYVGHYTYVYPLLKKYNYPALFAVYTAKIDQRLGRPAMTWEQIKEMSTDPLITISSHSVSHKVMAEMPPEQLQAETVLSKQRLESILSVPIRYFTYPEGKFDQAAIAAVETAGYSAALTMNDLDERLAGQSDSLLAIDRVGQSRLAEMVEVAWGGEAFPALSFGFNFNSPVQKMQATIDNTPFIFIAGGKPITIHAKTRGQVPEILKGTEAIAAVDGGFFSLEFLDSNKMLGPVFSRLEGEFIPGNPGEIPLINKRPLVLISDTGVRFVPFDNTKHNTLEGIQAELPDVKDAFVGAAFLVENGQPQPPERFGKLFDFNAPRHRAFWGINNAGQPQIGVSTEPIGSVDLGIALAKAGFRDAVMLDSGASTSLAYHGTSLVGYEPRPVPHVVALVPPAGSVATDSSARDTCALVSAR